MSMIWYIIIQTVVTTALLLIAAYYEKGGRNWMNSLILFVILGSLFVLDGIFIVMIGTMGSAVVASYSVAAFIATTALVMVIRLLYTHTRTPKEIIPIAIIGIAATVGAAFIMTGYRNGGNPLQLYLVAVPVLYAAALAAIGFVLFRGRAKPSGDEKERLLPNAGSSK
jgi:hypothetical protein